MRHSISRGEIIGCGIVEDVDGKLKNQDIVDEGGCCNNIQRILFANIIAIVDDDKASGSVAQ